MAIQKIEVVTKTGFVKYLYKYNSFGNISKVTAGKTILENGD